MVRRVGEVIIWVGVKSRFTMRVIIAASMRIQ